MGDSDNILSSDMRKFDKQVQTEDNMSNICTQTKISLVSPCFDDLFRDSDVLADLVKETEFKKRLI